MVTMGATLQRNFFVQLRPDNQQSAQAADSRLCSVSASMQNFPHPHPDASYNRGISRPLYHIVCLIKDEFAKVLNGCHGIKHVIWWKSNLTV